MWLRKQKQTFFTPPQAWGQFLSWLQSALLELLQLIPAWGPGLNFFPKQTCTSSMLSLTWVQIPGMWFVSFLRGRTLMKSMQWPWTPSHACWRHTNTEVEHAPRAVHQGGKSPFRNKKTERRKKKKKLFILPPVLDFDMWSISVSRWSSWLIKKVFRAPSATDRLLVSDVPSSYGESCVSALTAIKRDLNSCLHEIPKYLWLGVVNTILFPL